MRIRCRAKINKDCFDGKSTVLQFGYEATMADDGTYDRDTDTIVCDACYVHLMPFTPSGRGLNPELVGEALGRAVRLARG